MCSYLYKYITIFFYYIAAMIVLNSTVSVTEDSGSFMICASLSGSSLSLDQSIIDSLTLTATTINGTAMEGNIL